MLFIVKKLETIPFLIGTTEEGLAQYKWGVFCLCGHGAAEGSRPGFALHHFSGHTHTKGFPCRKQLCPVKPFTPSFFFKMKHLLKDKVVQELTFKGIYVTW